jgi:outer membrane protein OmpA-like peptidoglycan-associated protein
MKRFLPLIIILFASFSLTAQQSHAQIEGYVFESGNRGYLADILIQVFDNRADTLISECVSNQEGFFSCKVPTDRKFTVTATHEYFHNSSMSTNTLGLEDGKKAFLKFEMKRAPGYMFEITIAEEREDDETPVDAIKSADIEVYNNTTKELVLTLEDYQNPDFEVHLKKGNHYTLMIRKDGFLTKRMEAFVDVKGCILCFEGIGAVRPGVTDNLTEQNSFGTLLANVELERVHPEMEIRTNTIYYEAASYELSDAAKVELDKLRVFLADNPNLVIELGSHTDSRGNHIDNLELSEKRAQTAVAYVLKDGTVDNTRLKAKGYGFTQVLNDCKFGIPCSDEAHAVNRRTELKLINILKEGKYITRSLASLKQAEHMDALLAEIQNEGVVEIPSNGELPKEFRKEKKKIDRINREYKERSSEVKNEVSSVISDIVAEEDEQSRGRTFDDFPQEVIEEVKEEEVEMEETKEMMEDELLSSSEEVIQIEEAVAETVLEIEESVINVPTDMDKEVATDNMSEVATMVEVKEEVVEEMEAAEEVVSEAPEQALSRGDVPEGMAGHHIVLTQSKEELKANHPIHLIFPDVNVIQSPTTNKFMYLFGGFESEQEAQEYLDSNVKKMFSDAYLIQF